MKKENMLTKLPEEIIIDLPCVAKVEIGEHQLFVNNKGIATESDDDKLFDYAMVAVGSLFTRGFDVTFINHDTEEEKCFWYEH